MMLGKLLPNAHKNKLNISLNTLLYTVFVDWGWSYEQFCNTPIPIVMRLLKKHTEIKKKNTKK